MDMVLEGRMFVAGSIVRTAVGIKDGRIAAIGSRAKAAGVTMDLGDKLVLPGFVDPHVHFRDPGMTHKEDFHTGTMSAVHAGVTCILDMPNTEPPVTSLSSFKVKKASVAGKACTDYGLFSALTSDCNVEELAPISAGFKLYMGSTTGDLLMNSQQDIREKLKSAAATGRTVSVHAEDDSLITRSREKGNSDHLRNRPAEAETEAVRRLSGFRDNPINICHVSAPETLGIISHPNMTTEVTAHHLLLSALSDKDANYKVNPPLRSEHTREGLLSMFAEGMIDMIGSDHAPHTDEEKAMEYDKAPSGIASVETTIPIFLNMVREGKIPMDLLVRMASETPARVFGMNKGRIEPGYDADLVVIDLNRTRKIKGKDLHGKSGFTVYEGWDAVFPETVMIRGNIQIDEGEFCGNSIGEDIRG